MGKFINLETFGKGAISAKINNGLEELINDIRDTNTEYDEKRKLIIEITLIGEENREDASITIACKTKLAPKKKLIGKVRISEDGKNVFLTKENKKQIPGQCIIELD